LEVVAALSSPKLSSALEGEGAVVDGAVDGEGEFAAAATQVLLVDHFGVAASIAAHVASDEPTATHVLAVVVEQTSVVVQSAVIRQTTHEPPLLARNLGLAASIAAHVASLEPTATQVLGVAVEQTSVVVQSAVLAHATQAEPTNLGVAALMATQVVSSVAAAKHSFETVDHLGLAASIAAHVASLDPTATQVLGVAVEQTSVELQSEVCKHSTHLALQSPWYTCHSEPTMQIGWS